MSLAFDLIHDRRRAVERARRWRQAQRTLMAWSLAGALLAVCCAVFAYTFFGFFFL